MSQLLLSLVREIECTDPRMTEFGDNAHEFKFVNFAYVSFEEDQSFLLNLKNVSEMVGVWLDALEENMEFEGHRDDTEEFLETIQEFRNALSAATLPEKTELTEQLLSDLQKSMNLEDQA